MNLIFPDRITPTGDFSCHREDEWNVFLAHPGRRDGAAPSFAQLLAWNATLAGAAKFGLSPELEPLVQAQVPLRDYHSANQTALHAATAEGLGVARLLWQESFPAAIAWPRLPATQPSPTELLEACSGAGWKAKADASGGVAIDLGGGARWQQARAVTLAGDGGTWLDTELVALRDPAPATLRAVSQLLLLIGGMLRWARPLLRAQTDGLVGGLQILVPGLPTPAELDDACCIFAVAGEVWGHELTALLDPAAAQDYLTATAPTPFV